ncbi:MAG: hypothetical protein GY880_26720, partial [Planctomycetaceae bacterium]|nr:hypothetical protein [Planctomycetaceae bacterium]
MNHYSGNERPLFSLRIETRILFCWAILLLIASPNLFADDAENVTKTRRKVSDFRKDLKVFMKLSKSPDPQTER